MLKRDQCWRCDTISSTPTTKTYCNRCGVTYYCTRKCKGSDEFRHQVDCQTASLKRKCSGCDQEKTALKQCSGCRKAWYCDKECQKKSWPTHKLFCKQVIAKISELSKKLETLSNTRFPQVRMCVLLGKHPGQRRLQSSLERRLLLFQTFVGSCLRSWRSKKCFAVVVQPSGNLRRGVDLRFKRHLCLYSRQDCSNTVYPF